MGGYRGTTGWLHVGYRFLRRRCITGNFCSYCLCFFSRRQSNHKPFAGLYPSVSRSLILRAYIPYAENRRYIAVQLSRLYIRIDRYIFPLIRRTGQLFFLFLLYLSAGLLKRRRMEQMILACQ